MRIIVGRETYVAVVVTLAGDILEPAVRVVELTGWRRHRTHVVLGLGLKCTVVRALVNVRLLHNVDRVLACQAASVKYRTLSEVRRTKTHAGPNFTKLVLRSQASVHAGQI